MNTIKQWTLGLTLALMGAAAAAQQTQAIRMNIGAQALDKALNNWAGLTGYQILISADNAARSRMAPKVDGVYTPEDALKLLLKSSGLQYEFVENNTVAIRAADQGQSSEASGRASGEKSGANAASGQVQMRVAEAAQESGAAMPARQEDGQEEAGGIPEILVKGSRALNIDTRRSVNDPQPYVIFERSTLERAAASSLGDFLKQRLPANATSMNNVQSPGASTMGNISTVNLRGLGANQTLILVDGRRTATINGLGSPAQGDLNGIPLAAVERIEVLPTTASGIYGGSATGGVINIILRRDYAGAEIKASYENTYDSIAPVKRADFSGGFTLEEGKTNVSFAASIADADPLVNEDRDFLRRGIQRYLENNGNNYDALTGSYPSLGATPNIRSSDGDNLILKNGTALNSPITYIPYRYAGGDGGVALVANAGRYNLDPSNSASSGGGGKQGLVGGTDNSSLMTTLRRQFGTRVEAFAEGMTSSNRGNFPFNFVNSNFTIERDAPGNPFDQDVDVTVAPLFADGALDTKTRTDRLTGGIIVKLPARWSAEMDYAWIRSAWEFSGLKQISAAGTDAIASGALNVLRDIAAYPVDVSSYVASSTYTTSPFETVVQDTTLRFAGPIAQLPAGPVQLSSLMERRDENMATAGVALTGRSLTYPERSQLLESVYAEARIPLASPAQQLFALREMELQLAVRRDQYTTHGVTSSLTTGSTTPIRHSVNETQSTNPTVALRYQPIEAVMLRMSYGTGFLPPAVNQILPAPSINAFTYRDPRRGGASVTLPAGQLTQGGNPELEPEESRTFSAGFVLTPRWMKGLRLSVDYSRINKSDNITAHPLGVQGIINDEAILPGRVVRGPNLPGDPVGYAGPITRVDGTLLNLAKAELKAYDFQIDYELETANQGTFDFYSLGTWTDTYLTQTRPGQPLVENVGIAGAVNGVLLKFRANAGVTWTRQNWVFGWAARYFDSYVPSINPDIVLSQGSNGTVDSQLFHDVFAIYRFTGQPSSSVSKLLSDTELQLGLKNVFNTSPAFDAGTNSGAYYSTLADPRLRSYYLSIKKAF